MQDKKPFDLQAALNGAKLVTRDGREVSLFMHDPCPNGSAYNYLAYIGNTTYCYSENGKFYVDGSYDHELDLFLAEPATKTMWVNVLKYDDSVFYPGSYFFETKEQAEANIKELDCHYATLPIEIPVK